MDTRSKINEKGKIAEINQTSIFNNIQKFINVLLKDLTKNRIIYLMALPGIMYYIIYHYWPMYGAIIAFNEFNPADGILRSPWVGFMHFQNFFRSFYFGRILRNTLLINVYTLVWGFPAPIILALLFNEIRKARFKRLAQTIAYLPHFISVVVICGLIVDFTSHAGLVNYFIELFGGERQNLLMKPQYFRTIFVSTEVLQRAGWGSIVYLAALTGIDAELYSAAQIDGAGRWKQLWHVTIPGILPTIVILLILRLGQMMNVGFEKIMLLYNPVTYSTADVISTFVYRKGILEANFSYSAAVGLFNSVINFILLILSNKFSRKISEISLW